GIHAQYEPASAGTLLPRLRKELGRSPWESESDQSTVGASTPRHCPALPAEIGFLAYRTSCSQPAEHGSRRLPRSLREYPLGTQGPQSERIPLAREKGWRPNPAESSRTIRPRSTEAGTHSEPCGAETSDSPFAEVVGRGVRDTPSGQEDGTG